MTHYDANDSWKVRGKLQASAQATQEGDAVILDSNNKIPGTLINNIVETFSVPASSWSGSGPYTASVVLQNIDSIAVPDFAPDNPNVSQRTGFASARVSVSAIDMQTKTVTLVADGDKPTVPLPCLVTGLAGTPTGKWTSSFPGGLGGGGGTTYTMVVTVSPASAESVSGITVTIEDSNQVTQSDTTDANGQVSFNVDLNETYSVSCSGTELVFSTVQPVTITNTTTSVSVTATAYPTISISAGAVASGCAYSIVGTQTYSGVLNTSGQITVAVAPDTYTVSITPPAAYFTPATQTVSNATEGNDYPVTFTLQAKPILNISATDAYQGGTTHQSRPVTATNGTDTQTGTTDSNGQCTMTLQGTGEYTISIGVPTSTYFSPSDATQTVVADQSYNISFILNRKPTVAVQVVDNSGAGAVSGRTAYAAISGQTTLNTNTDSNGLSTRMTLQAEGTCELYCDEPSTDYVTVAHVSQVVAANNDYTVTVYMDKKPTIKVTVADSSSLISSPSTTQVKATLSSDSTVYGTAYLDSNLEAVIMVPQAGTYTVEVVTAISGGTASTASVTVALNDSEEPAAITVTAQASGFKFTMNYDSSTFATDPGGSLTYADDCAGFTPVSSPPSSLGACQALGDWAYNNDGSSSNPLLDKCFYCTFHETQITGESGLVPYEKLNPNDLTMVIAIWDETNEEWVAEANPTTGTSHITTLNTMFCYPALYRSASSGKISISDSSSNGTAYGATIDGKTYEYVAIGVYGGYNDSSVLKSLSGKADTGSVSRPNFRTYAQANTVKNGKAMVWNFHQWQDMRIMTLFAMKHFNGQTQIGQGGRTYNSGTTGLCNGMGPFAGDSSTSTGTSTDVKAFIESPWGHKYWFIDDFVNISKVVYVGQHSQPLDPNQSGYDASTMTSIGSFATTGLAPNAISEDAISWGMGTAMGGGASTGLCDGQWVDYSNATGYLGCVGGASDNVSSGYAGPSFLYAADSLSYSNGSIGARLAFVFDL